MKLSGKQLGELREVVLGAITNYDDLALLVSDEMSIRLPDVVKPGTLPVVVEEFLNYLQTRGTLVSFIDVLTPKHPHLAESLKPFRGLAMAPPEGADRLWTGAGLIGGWIIQHPWYACCIAVPVLALTVVGVIVLWRHTKPQDNNEPLTPIHAPEIWEKSFVIRGQRIAYASPDTTYQILEERLNKAEKSILIAVYEFTSVPVKELVLNALQRGVKVTLLLGSRFNPSPERPDFIDELTKKGVEVVEPPREVKGPFFVYHPKIIVIDHTWTLVQTGNLSPTSVPLTGGAVGQPRRGDRDSVLRTGGLLL